MKLLLCLLLLTVPLSARVYTTTTIGRSMKPTIPWGGRIVVATSIPFTSLRIGQIVVVRDRWGGSYVHRITGIDRRGRFFTKGDNCLIPDRWMVTPSNLIGVVTSILPPSTST